MKCAKSDTVSYTMLFMLMILVIYYCGLWKLTALAARDK